MLTVMALLLLAAVAAAVFVGETGFHVADWRLGDWAFGTKTIAEDSTAPPAVKPDPHLEAQAPEPPSTAMADPPAADEKVVARIDAPPARPVRPATTRPQEIRISTNPRDAKVVLDGNSSQFCFAPCVLRSMPGTHHVTIANSGYENVYEEIHVGEEALDLGEVHLQPVQGTLMLSTDPQGARIRINGTEIPDVTPAKLALKPGVYSVTVEKDGRSASESISIGDGTSYRKIPLRS
jgi:hypothetical protein